MLLPRRKWYTHFLEVQITRTSCCNIGKLLVLNTFHLFSTSDTKIGSLIHSHAHLKQKAANYNNAYNYTASLCDITGLLSMQGDDGHNP